MDHSKVVLLLVYCICVRSPHPHDDMRISEIRSCIAFSDREFNEQANIFPPLILGFSPFFQFEATQLEKVKVLFRLLWSIHLRTLLQKSKWDTFWLDIYPNTPHRGISLKVNVMSSCQMIFVQEASSLQSWRNSCVGTKCLLLYGLTFPGLGSQSKRKIKMFFQSRVVLNGQHFHTLQDKMHFLR